MSLLEHALQYAARGWRVFAVSGKKIPYAGTHGHLDATTATAELEAQFGLHPYANVALACGDLVVLDPDGPGGWAKLQALVDQYGPLPPTLTATTSRGRHIYFHAPAGLKIKGYTQKRPKGKDGLDVKGAGGFVLLPPSVNRATGFRYRWDEPQLPIAELPAWVLTWLETVRRAATLQSPVPQSKVFGPRPAYLPAPTGLATRVLEADRAAELPEFLAALKLIDPACGYDDWYMWGACIFDFDPGPGGLFILREWSKLSSNPQHLIDVANGACEKKWAEYQKPKPGKRLKTKASIYDEAKRLRLVLPAPQEPAASPQAPAPQVNGHAHLPEAIRAAPDRPIRFVDFDAEGEPRGTCTNAGIAIEGLRIDCRKDTFHEKMLVGGHPIAQWAGDLSDDVVHMLRKVIKRGYGFDPGEKNMRDAAIQLCLEHQFNPVQDYLAGVQWDGVPRLGVWVVAYLGASDTVLTREMGKLMLLAAVRRARQPGTKFDHIVVFEGREGTGKSTAIKILAGEDNFSDQNILAVSDKEQQEAFQGVWLHEIAELAGMRRTDVERIKQFASRTEDRARPAYGRIRVDMKRRGIFIATTNESQYLKSETGNRRFWPIETGCIDLEGLSRDRDQLWAEAARLEAEGASIVLAERFRPAASEEQGKRLDQDAWEAMVRESLQISKKDDCSITEVLLSPPFHLGAESINQVSQNRVARILMRFGFTRYQKRLKDGREWRYKR